MDMQEALRKAGIPVPDKHSKIEKNSQSTQIKINEAYKIVCWFSIYKIEMILITLIRGFVISIKLRYNK